MPNALPPTGPRAPTGRTTPTPPSSPARAPAPPPAAPSGPWSQRFIGRQIAYFADEFPNWTGVMAHATRVIGLPEGYDSIEAARAAVAKLRPMPQVTDLQDWKAYPNAVAYLRNDVGQVAAFELDQPVLSKKGIFRIRPKNAPDFLARDERVIAIDNYAGPVPCRGVREGTIIV